MSYTLLSIGDSVVWGQGLAEEEKFRVGLRQDLQVLLDEYVEPKDFSHSGAVLARSPEDGSPEFAQWHPEVPRHAPSIWAQWDRWKGTGQRADVVLLNGGINDVDFRTISSLVDRRAEIASLVSTFCGQTMHEFLQDGIFAAGRPCVMVTGYYPAISSASGFGVLPKAITTAEALINYLTNLHGKDKVVEELTEALSLRHLLSPHHLLGTLAQNWETFALHANACLQSTVDAVNAELGEQRVWFVDPAFGPEHAMFTPVPYLFHPCLPPQDPAAETRKVECPNCYPALEHPLELAVCLAASTGHPNAGGARRYRERLRDAALPELARQLKAEQTANRSVAVAASAARTAVGTAVTNAPDAGADRAEEFLVSPYSPAIPEDAKLRLKGQLHVHWYDDAPFSHIPIGSFENDLSRTPFEVACEYRTLGYDFLAFTEHDDPKVLRYLQQHPHFGPASTYLVPATQAVTTAPTFIEILYSEEVTPEENHVLAFGVPKQVPAAAPGQNTSFFELAKLVTKEDQDHQKGIAFLPHPLQYYNGSYGSFAQQITLPGSPETPFSAISVRTGGSAPLSALKSAIMHKDSLGLWDVLLNKGVYTHTAEGKKILLPAYSEDDYAPLGFGEAEILRPGSTWIELEIDKNTLPWPEPRDLNANLARQTTLLTALQSGRWWTYWVDFALPWPKHLSYPRLTLCLDQLKGELTVTSDLKLASLSFITRNGMTRPERYENVKSQTFTCTGNEQYVRIAAKYISEDKSFPYELRVVSNPVWVRPSKPALRTAFAAAVAPPPAPTAPPQVTISRESVVHFLQGTAIIPLHVTGDVIHAPVLLNNRVAAFAKPGPGDQWKVEVPLENAVSGSYQLQVQVVDREGRSASDTVQIDVRSDATAPAITIDPASLPASLPTDSVIVTGTATPSSAGVRLLGVLVTMDGHSTYGGAITEGTWSCLLPAQAFPPGLHTLEAVVIDEQRGSASATTAVLIA